MNNEFYGNFTLAILGGGQLGRMLIQEAVNFCVDTKVLDPDANAPCRFLTKEFVHGSLSDYDTVMAFGKEADVITIEIEHVNVKALKDLESSGIKVFPQPHVLEIIQDKGLQKQFYTKHNIPTAAYELSEGKERLKDLVNEKPVVQKLRKGGYDGKGVVVIKNIHDLDKAFNDSSVLEEKVVIEKEISVIVARNDSGEIKTFPVVELEYNQEANLVEFLFSPADLNEALSNEAERIARLVAEKFEIVGLLAVEMFVTPKGEILVNEVAPRPHNSGHQSIEGNITSQYEQHLRAILNLPLGDTSVIMPSVMLNLLGEKGFEGDVKYEGISEVLKMEGFKLHLYGKKTTKPFRKMGHVTIIDQDLERAKQKAIKVKEVLKVKSV